MQITTKLDHISSDFITQYLSALGIEDIKRYLKPTKKNYENHWNYPNINKAVEILNWYIEVNDNPIGIICDSDADGACSAALIYNFLTFVGKTNIKMYFHEGKQHGITDKLEEIIASNGSNSLLIVPDAGSNNTEECKTLKENGIEVLIADHHIFETTNTYATIVNNQLEGVTNKSLSGTGVTDKLIRAYCEKYNVKYPNYTDLVAVSLVTDICDLTSMENRWYVYNGLKTITNPFLNYLFENCCKQRGYTPEAIGWNIGPLANTLARSEEQENKTLFFDGLIGKINPEEALKKIRKIKRAQDEEVKSVVKEIEPNLDFSTKVIIGFTSPENANFTGLIANKFTGKYNKPTIILRNTKYGSWSGSLRSPTPLATKINESGIASAQGHEEACSVIVKQTNLDKFKKWLDLLDLSEQPNIEVTAKINLEDITLDICQAIQQWNELWGHGIESPTFYLKTILTQDQILVFTKNTTTLKLHFKNCDCIKFFATQDDIINFKKHFKFEVELVLKNLTINEYEGTKTPQAIIDKYEIHPIPLTEENWIDSF